MRKRIALCAVTGERTLPILDAAHIQPYSEGGEHNVTNGLLLRTDIHRLFDLGYVTVSSGGRFEVGRRLREDFENGRHYYAMHGLSLPLDPDSAQRAKLSNGIRRIGFWANLRPRAPRRRGAVTWKHRTMAAGPPMASLAVRRPMTIHASKPRRARSNAKLIGRLCLRVKRRFPIDQ